MVQDKHIIITIMGVKNICKSLLIEIMTTYIKACRNANISETGLDRHMDTISYPLFVPKIRKGTHLKPKAEGNTDS